MFTSETIVLNNMVNRVSDWDSTINSDQDFNDIFSVVDDRLRKMYLNFFGGKIVNDDNENNGALNGLEYVAYLGTQGKAYPGFFLAKLMQKGYVSIESNCGNDIVSNFDKITGNKYMKSACKNFDLSKWDKFTHIIQDVCEGSHPKSDEIDSGGKLHPYVDSLCKRGDLFKNKNNNMPGGNTIKHLADNTQSEMFDFLNKKETYLTFGSNAPYTITYSSSKSETLTISASLTSSEDFADSVGVDHGNVALVVGVKLTYDLSRQQRFSISDTKSSTKSHGTTNTISVTFADDDLGELLYDIKQI
jgi:hypothetical protein